MSELDRASLLEQRIANHARMIWSLAALAQALAERSNQKDIAGMLNRLGSLAKSEFEAGVMCDKSRAASETTINAAP